MSSPLGVLRSVTCVKETCVLSPPNEFYSGAFIFTIEGGLLHDTIKECLRTTNYFQFFADKLMEK